MAATSIANWHAKGSPLFYLVAGFIFICVGVKSIIKGKAYSHGWADRAEEPKTFWWIVAMDFLIGLFLVGYCLSLI